MELSAQAVKKIVKEELKEEQDKKWEENQAEIRKFPKAITRIYETAFGALVARWGLRSEASFRNALKGLLKDFNIKVLNVKEYDDDGEVFGRPVEIELDIIIINGTLMISESMRKTGQAGKSCWVE
ncbi:MAG: DUF3782 domain-containing protein [bacterium]|nr:DUF3782 domain-containing protein [bacterium]